MWGRVGIRMDPFWGVFVIVVFKVQIGNKRFLKMVRVPQSGHKQHRKLTSTRHDTEKTYLRWHFWQPSGTPFLLCLRFHLVASVFTGKPIAVFSSFNPGLFKYFSLYLSPFVNVHSLDLHESPFAVIVKPLLLYPVNQCHRKGSERIFFWFKIINLGDRDLHQPTDSLIYLEWKCLHFLLKRKIGLRSDAVLHL